MRKPGAIPSVSGVYLFRNAKEGVIYVGKAKNLQTRVGSYFSSALEAKTAKMLSQANSLKFIAVESEFDAILLEASLIKKYRPKYNIQLRDDKSPLYIGITKEVLPRIILLRQRELEGRKLRQVFGPFVNTSAPKKVLRLVRRIFPYSTHRPTGRACVYSQIGLCKPCPSDVAKNLELKKEYLLNVRRVKAVLSGKSNFIIKQLERDMQNYSKKEKFEQARDAKGKLEALVYTTTRQELDQGYIDNPNLLEDIRLQEIKSLAAIINFHFPVFKKKLPKRIECYDVAHLAGTYPTASMVTFIDGEPDKTLYRHFRLHHTMSDVDNMKEVIKRRFKNSGWGLPDLIIVDGGKAQVAAAQEVQAEIPIVGLAKREETLVFKLGHKFLEKKLPDGPAKQLAQRVRNEAHRFARVYHHKLVSRAIIG
jgi:excinuclease ABC subunit C